MPTESRPNLRGLTEQQRTLALGHWWLWRICQENECFHLDDSFGDGTGKCSTLRLLESQMQPETKYRLALARGAYFREVNS